MAQGRLDTTDPKPGISSMTIGGAILLIVSLILDVLGFDPTLLDFLHDGLQMTEIAQLIGVIIVILGRFRATRVVSGFFTTK